MLSTSKTKSVMPNCTSLCFIYFSEPGTDEIVVVGIETLTSTEEFSAKNDEKSTSREENGKNKK